MFNSRYSDPRNPIEKPKAASLVAAYEGAKEVQTLAELDELISDPDSMRMQALLVRERILGPAHPDTSYYIRYRGAVYADMGYFERCIALWMYALDMQMDKLDPLSPMTQSSLLSFAELFSFMMGNGRHRSNSLIRFDDICAVFSKAIIELERGRKVVMDSGSSPSERELSHYSRIIIIIMHLMSLICSLSMKLTAKQEFTFKKLVYHLIVLEPRGPQGQTLLHLAANHETTNVGKYPVCNFPCINCINLLTELGANTNTVDLQGNTTLHTACANQKVNADILLSLLNSGAHIDTVNGEGKMALDVCKPYHDPKSPLPTAIMPHKYLTLKCLAAKAVRKYKIKYRDVHEDLRLFTDRH